MKLGMLIVVACAGLGCRKWTPDLEGRVNATEAQRTLTKLSTYIECLDHSHDVFVAADRFRELHAVQQIAGTDSCLDAVEKVTNVEPRLPEIEAAGLRFATALRDLGSLTAHDGERDRGKLEAAFAAFDRAQGELFDKVFLLNRKLHRAELAEREKREGRSQAVLSQRVVLEAEELVELAAIRWNELDKLDVTELGKRVEAFDVVVKELAFYASTVTDPDKQKHLEDILDGARACSRAAKLLMRRARDHIAYSDAEQLLIEADKEAEITGTPAAVIEAYNTLVGL